MQFNHPTPRTPPPNSSRKVPSELLEAMQAVWRLSRESTDVEIANVLRRVARLDEPFDLLRCVADRTEVPLAEVERRYAEHSNK